MLVLQPGLPTPSKELNYCFTYRREFSGTIWRGGLATTAESIVAQWHLGQVVGVQRQCLQNKVSVPVQSGNLEEGDKSAWVKTRMNFTTDFRAALLCPGRESNSEPCPCLIIALSLSNQEAEPGHTGSYTVLSTPLRTVLTEGRACDFPHMQSKTCGLTWPTNSVCTLAWFRGPRSVQLSKSWVLACPSSRVWKLIHSPVYYWTLTSVSHLGSLTRESTRPKSPSYSLSWVENQDNSPSQLFSATDSPVSRCSELGLLPLLKTDHRSKPQGHYLHTYPVTQTEMTGEGLSLQVRALKSAREA